MGGEAAPDFIFDHSIYYHPAANSYGYYCTGIESPGKWDDHQSFWVLDGQNPHCLGPQAENLPYVYYAPSYGYGQSDYNPYNPFIPGAVVGFDRPFIGTQQYFNSPITYQQSVSSTPYVPVNFQSNSDVRNGTSDPLLVSPVATIASKRDIDSPKCAPPEASADKAAASQGVALVNSSSETSSQQIHTLANLSEVSLSSQSPSEQCASHGSMLPSNVPDLTQSQGGHSSGSVQATDNLFHGRVPPVEDSSGDMSHILKWATVDKFRPQFQSNRFLYNGSRSPYMLSQQNRGPRSSKARDQWTSIMVKSYTTRVDVTDSQGNIIINAGQYNRDDFTVEYPDAKFFVIKSYSEDDVHKSIKYNVWSSTPNGNRRLDSVYEDARRLSVGKLKNCPVFLFFSVNASGQFCGVAEMTGPVNFQKHMDFWQQDKWTGSFPVKWHIVKDVPNSSLRHIILENNENKPVTHSRDTQEITYMLGLNMLKIFKSSTLNGSILDDFFHYEEKEKATQREKSRLLRKTYNSSLFVPAFVPTNILNSSVNQPPPADDILQDDTVSQFKKMDEKPADNEILKNDQIQNNCAVSHPPNAGGKQSTGIVKQNLKVDGKDDEQPNNAVDQTRKMEGEKSNVTANQLHKVNGKQLLDVADQLLKADEKQQNSTVGYSPKADGRQANCSVIQPQPNSTNDQPLEGHGRQPNYSFHPPKADGKRLDGTAIKPPQADGKQANSTVRHPWKATAGKRFHGIVHHSRSTVGYPSKPDDLKSEGYIALTNEQIFPKLGASRRTDDKKDAKPRPIANPGRASPVMKTLPLSINSMKSEADRPNDVADVVTVGSLHIKVQDVGESSSMVLTFGTAPVEQQGPNLDKKAY